MNEELKIILSAEIKELKNALKQAEDAIGKTADSSSKLEKIGTTMKKVASNVAKVSAAAFGAAAAGVTALTKSAIENYAEYEQLVGGVETLFKDSAGIVKGYADEAFQSAGMSANEYMSTVTSFSASLLQSLDGDTKAAAEAANQAVIDMSDNANKMGTSIESIQNAYQGFAKQNFTMLDNLKLGYGGTKEEMQRLLDDAEKISGIKYDISNLNDVYSAIHIVQTELGITGTTAKEASSTIQGSAAAMKSSWSNLLTGLADENADFDKLLDNFIKSVGTFAKNLIPRVKVALNGITKLISELAPQIIDIIPTLVEEVLPIAVEAVTGIIEALAETLPSIIDAIMQVLPQLTEAILGSLPLIIEAILQVITGIIESLAEMLPTILEQIVAILPQIINSLIEGIPALLEAAIQLLMAIVDAIPEILPPLIAALPQIIDSVIDTLLGNLSLLIDAAVELFNAIVEAIPIIIPVIVEALPEIITSIVDALIEAIPILLEGAFQLFMAIVQAIPKIIPPLIKALPQIVTTVITNLKDKLVEVFGSIWNKLTEIFGKVKDWFKQKFTDAVTAIKNVFSSIGDFFTGVWNKIKNIFSKVGKAIGDAVSGAFKNAINFVLEKAIGIINGFIGAINTAIGIINKIPGVSIKKLSKLDVPKLAKGGIIDSATIAEVGEDGTEAVVPLENNLGWLDKLAAMLNERMGGSAPIILQVDGKTFAQISVDSINQLTKQTGSLPLQLV